MTGLLGALWHLTRSFFVEGDKLGRGDGGQGEGGVSRDQSRCIPVEPVMHAHGTLKFCTYLGKMRRSLPSMHTRTQRNAVREGGFFFY